MIPLIDISDPRGLRRRVEEASRDIGFMYLAGHGIPAQQIEALRASVAEFFALPIEEKTAYCITPENYRGYIPLGFFSANTGGAADRYEGYKLHGETDADDPIRSACDLYGPNKWPAHPVALRRQVLAYWQECDRLSGILLEIFAEILGTDTERFCGLFKAPLTNMTLLHYPPQRPDESGFGIHPHKDTDVLTILAPDITGGLLVRRRNSTDWIRADAPADTLIVNIGDLMELWSGGYLVSTPHKVVNTGTADRYSFPYFVVPRYDTLVEPLLTPQPGFVRRAVHVGDVSREVWRTNWHDAKPDEDRYDVGTLED